MYYRVKDGKIIDWAVAPYSEDCLYTEHQVRYDYRGNPYIDKGQSSFPIGKRLMWYFGVCWWVFLISTLGTIGLNIWRWVWQ